MIWRWGEGRRLVRGTPCEGAPHAHAPSACVRRHAIHRQALLAWYCSAQAVLPPVWVQVQVACQGWADAGVGVVKWWLE